MKLENVKMHSGPNIYVFTNSYCGCWCPDGFCGEIIICIGVLVSVNELTGGRVMKNRLFITRIR